MDVMQQQMYAKKQQNDKTQMVYITYFEYFCRIKGNVAYYMFLVV